MLFTAIVGALLAGSIAVSSFTPSDETLKLAFDRGQRFYVIEDYDQAIEKFEIVQQVEDSRLVDETKVLIRVGELYFPVKVAATFQLANSYSNLAVVELDKAMRSRDKSQAATHRQKAQKYFREAAKFFKEAGQSTNLLEIQVLSQYRLVKTYFRSREYENVIAQARNLIERFPESDYVDEALYEMGWAHYELGEYGPAIRAFEQLQGKSSADYRIDRAQFQIGKSYFAQSQYAEARRSLQKLVAKYDFSHLSESDRVKMEVQKLSGVVKETALELMAKAQLFIGNTYAAEANIEAAALAYRRVIDDYPQERALVEEAYVHIGEAHFEQDDVEGGVRVYRRAIDEVSNSGFRARMQARIARRYYEAKRFQEARNEYDIYINAYGGRAGEGGLTLDRARFQTAQCTFELAEESRSTEGLEQARSHYQQARATYLRVIADYAATDLQAESLFGAGLSAQRLGGEAGLAEALKLYGRIREEFGSEVEMVSRVHLQTARLHYMRQEYTQAAELYEKYLAEYPDATGPQILLELSLAYRDANRFDEAVATLELIPSDSEIWGKAGLLGGEFLLRQGRLDEAEAMLQRGLAAAPSAELHYVLGKVNFEQGKYAESVAAFATAQRQSDKTAVLQGTLLGQGTAHYKLGEFTQATGILERLLDETPPAGMKDQAHRLLGQCYVQLGRRAAAVKDYQAIIAASKDEQEKAEFTLLLAELYYSLERYEEAIGEAQGIIEADFEDRDEEGRGYLLTERAYFVLGDAYIQLKNYEQALEIFSVALKRYPRSSLRSDFLFGKAIAAFTLGDNETVVALLEEFTDRYGDNPNLENAFYFLAYAHLRRTNFDEAANWFGRLVERYPESEVAAEALFQRAENFFNLGRYQEAVSAYQGVLARYSRSEFVDNAIYNLGWCNFELDNKEEATRHFTQFLERFPQSPLAPSARFTLGDYYFNQKDYDNAATVYAQVVTDYPGSQMAKEAKGLLKELLEIQAYLKYEEAMAFFDQEDWARAAESLQEVVDNYPTTETRAGALANLGMSYEYLHKWKAAAGVYDQVLKNYGEVPESASAVAFAQEHLAWIVKNRL